MRSRPERQDRDPAKRAERDGCERRPDEVRFDVNGDTPFFADTENISDLGKPLGRQGDDHLVDHSPIGYPRDVSEAPQHRNVMRRRRVRVGQVTDDHNARAGVCPQHAGESDCLRAGTRHETVPSYPAPLDRPEERGSFKDPSDVQPEKRESHEQEKDRPTEAFCLNNEDRCTKKTRSDENGPR